MLDLECIPQSETKLLLKEIRYVCTYYQSCVSFQINENNSTYMTEFYIISILIEISYN